MRRGKWWFSAGTYNGKRKDPQKLKEISEIADGKVPNVSITATEEPKGAIVGYVNAGIKVTGDTFKQITASAEASAVHISQKDVPSIEQVNVDYFTAGASATTELIDTGNGSIPIYAGAEAGVHLFKAKASIFEAKLGAGVSTGAGIKDGSVEVKIAGCGGTIGRVTSISVFGNSIGIDIEPLFDLFGW